MNSTTKWHLSHQNIEPSIGLCTKLGRFKKWILCG